MVKHNNVVPNQHFKKKWQFYVKTWFNQPARKVRRRNARDAKAQKNFPRPTAGALRPIVHGQTLKYNTKRRAGRGFTHEELKFAKWQFLEHPFHYRPAQEAGIPIKLAPTIGILVDHRRRNRSLEGLQENATRLKAYKSKVLVFPRRSKKPRAGDASPEELSKAQQVTGPLVPVYRESAPLENTTVTEEMKAERAYYRLRLERVNKRHLGARTKRAAEAEALEKDKAK